jgi:hypothetical protein
MFWQSRSLFERFCSGPGGSSRKTFRFWTQSARLERPSISYNALASIKKKKKLLFQILLTTQEKETWCF